MQSCGKLLATGFGSGLSPVLPGTCGSAAAVLVWLMLGQTGLLDTPDGKLLVIVGTLVIGLLSIGEFLRTQLKSDELGTHANADPQVVVIDEWCGQFIALSAFPLHVSWELPLLAFVAFRIFDIVKPPPVNWLERLPGAWGVMFDDVAAGVYAFLCLYGLGVSKYVMGAI